MIINSRIVTVLFAAILLVGIGSSAFCEGKSSTPSRIVSLTPNNTEILFALGLGDRIVGVTSYCDYPSEAKKKAKVGDMNANVESVIGLKPDLVVAHGKLNDNMIPRLKSLCIEVIAIDPKTFSHVYADIRRLGRITGSVKRAEAIVKKMTGTVSAVRVKTVKSTQKKVLVAVQPSPLWAAGPGTFVDEMLRDCHAVNVAGDARSGFNQFSLEVAVSRNPDIIIVSRKQEREFILGNSLWKRTNAVKNKAVYVINGDYLFRPGPRLVIGLEQVAKVIHPEAFK